MSCDEPGVVATRLSTCLGAPLHRVSEQPLAPGAVLLLDDDQLDAVASDELLGAAAVVVAGTTPGSSAALRDLRDRVAQRGLAVGSATLATRAPDWEGAVECPLVVAGSPNDARVLELLAAGPHSLLLDAGVRPQAVGPGDAPARVCVVSFEASGMTGGGIGTASSSLAESLARHGHDVTLLFTGWQDAGSDEHNARWQAHYAERGVRLELLRAPGSNSVKSPHFPARSAYEVYCWLCAQPPFDVVHLPENMGHGAYAQQAKRCGLRFAETTFVVGTHGPTRWAAEANRIALTREELLINDALERFSVAHADVVLGPSRYLHDYLRARGWTLPERVHVQPYALPSVVRGRRDDAASADATARPMPSEIVFFGRIETRKGVATLCDALDLLAAEDPPAVEVTFLGPVAEVLGQPADAYIAARASAWPWTWRIVSDRDQQGAAAYLSREGVLAVMPSLVDNAPNTVSEVVALGIPFVAAASGGTGELVSAAQRDNHMFGASRPGTLPPPLSHPTPAIDAKPLAELLRRRLAAPVPHAEAPADADAVDAAYDRWHRAVRRERSAAREQREARPLPELAACVLFAGDEEMLASQLDALAVDGVETVVADLRPDIAPVATAGDRGVAVARPARTGHAADARTAAIAATSAPLVAIVPPGDVPLSAFAETLRRAAAATRADVYGCAVLDGLCLGDAAEAMRHAFVPIAGPPVAGLTHPAFAVGPYAIRREALDRLGGFAADAEADEVDHELLNRAAVAGLVLEVVPEPLAAKRRADRWSTFRAVWPHDAAELPYDAEQWLRVERPFAERPEVLADLVALQRGSRGEALRLHRLIDVQQRVYENRIAEHRTWIDNIEVQAAYLRDQLSRAEAARGIRGTAQRVQARIVRVSHRATEALRSTAGANGNQDRG